MSIESVKSYTSTLLDIAQNSTVENGKAVSLRADPRNVESRVKALFTELATISIDPYQKSRLYTALASSLAEYRRWMDLNEEALRSTVDGYSRLADDISTREGELTECATRLVEQHKISMAFSNVMLKRGSSDTTPQQQAKRQKTTTGAESVTNQERNKANMLKEKYTVLFSFDSEEDSESEESIDAEMRATLDSIQGKTWWISKDILNGREVYKGVIYLNEVSSFYPLSTDADVITFCEGRDPDLHVTMLQRKRREKINEIKSNYVVPPSRYHRKVLSTERRKGAKEACYRDLAEAKAVLGGVQGRTWWIREGIDGNQKVYKGITYSKGISKSRPLPTDNDLLAFCERKNPDTHLEVIRRKKKEEINEMKSKYVVPSSFSGYYKNVFTAESNGSFDEAKQLDRSEARVFSNQFQNDIWWVREGFLNGQKVYKGISYSSGDSFRHSTLHTDNDVIQFCTGKEPSSHLEELRKKNLFGLLKNLPKQLYDVLDAAYTLENDTDKKRDVLEGIVKKWLILVHSDRIAKKTDAEIVQLFQERHGIIIDDETVRSIKENEVIKILNVFKEKNKYDYSKQK